MPERDLEAEGHVMAIGVWQVGGGAAVLLLCVAALLKAGTNALPAIAPLAMGSALGIVLGCFLYQVRPWSRIAFGLFAALGLLQIVTSALARPGIVTLAVSALMGGWLLAQLWALFGPEGASVFAADYQKRRLEDGRRVSWWTSVFFVLPAIGVSLLGGLFVLALLR